MTLDLFRQDSYLKTVTAEVTAHAANGFITDQTIFYPHGGGQLGDTGSYEDGKIINTLKGEGDAIIHLVEEDANLPAVGSTVNLQLDWNRRYLHMRMHTALHLLCATVAAPVTGGSIGAEKSRLDFDLADAPDKEALTEALNALIAQDFSVTTNTITNDELDANPELVRTMSVQPPRGASGLIRMVRIGSDKQQVDYQPCGGTHLKSTAEIGKVRVSKTEKKGKQNRRISIVFADS